MVQMRFLGLWCDLQVSQAKNVKNNFENKSYLVTRDQRCGWRDLIGELAPWRGGST
jgi:hypothetical protein